MAKPGRLVSSTVLRTTHDWNAEHPSANGTGALSRREFLARSAAGLALLGVSNAISAAAPAQPPIFDLHFHCLHRGRPDDRIPVHQQHNGIRTTVMLPAGTTGGLGVGAGGVEH